MKLLKSVVVLASLAAVAVVARANAVAAPARAAASTNEKMAAEIERLQAEVREQRQLIMQLVRVEQEHYDLLLKLIQGRGGPAAVESGTPAPAPSAPAAKGPAPAAAGAAPGDAAKHAAAQHTGTLRGKIEFSGGPVKDLYVYVENVKSPPAHGHNFEIAQRDKQFVPEVAVVQRGTKVTFPNYDSVFHNVFSPTSPHPFDLGSYRAGDAAKSVELTAPGVVDVFCNVHSRMHASILVVPSSLYARVAADGSFHLDGVPLGSRKVVVWGPHSKPASQTIEVGPSGSDVTFTLEAQPQAQHNNKFGQPYGSYKD